MLNRRTLRIKAMQSIYAFKQCQQSNYQNAVDLIKDAFLPDLNSMEKQDPEKLEKNKTQAIKVFAENYDKEALKTTEELSPEVKKATINAVTYYHRQIAKDKEFLRQTMLSEADKIHDRYFYLLQMLLEFADLVGSEEDERKSRLGVNLTVSFKNSLNLSKNRIIELFRNDKGFQANVIKRNIIWNKELDHLRYWYREVLKKDPEYITYSELVKPGFEEDKKIITHIVKNIIFKNDLVNSFMDDQDLYWTENKAILKGMIVKTIKSIEEGQESLELMDLSANWEDDRQFFIELFDNTLRKDEEFEGYIIGKAKNWDIERITLVDKIIIKMALAELVHFPSIPVKVTINEFIEVSKEYSTPKSRQFINGLLDVLANELISTGVIRKSGRGLIDNK